MKNTLSWTEIKERYPDKWVFLKDVVKDNNEIISFTLLAICNLEEKIQLCDEYSRKGIEYACFKPGDNLQLLGFI